MSKTVYENVEELAVESDTSALSRNALTYTEQALYLAEATEAAYNEMMKSIGIEELSVYEATGEAVVYEGANFKGLIDKVVKFLKDFWGKVKGFFDDTYKKFEDAWKERKEKIADTVKVDNLSESNYKAGKVYNYEKLTSTTIDGISSKAADLTKKLNGTSVDELDNINVVEQIIGDLVPSPGSIGEATTKLKDVLKGEKVDATVDYVKKNWNEIRNCFVKGNGFKVALKSAFKAEKKVVDKAISSAKNLKESDDPEVIKKAIKLYKDIVVASKSLLFAAIDVAKLQDTEYKGLFVKVARATANAKAAEGSTEAKNESVELGTSQKDLIKESFNW